MRPRTGVATVTIVQALELQPRTAPGEEVLGTRPRRAESLVERAREQHVMSRRLEIVLRIIGEKVRGKRKVRVVIQQRYEVLKHLDFGVKIGDALPTLAKEGVDKRGLHRRRKFEDVIEQFG